MSQINYVRLSYLLNTYPTLTEIIKDQYLILLSDLSETNYITTDLFKKNIERIDQMGAIIVAYIGNPNGYNFEIIGTGTIIIEPKIIRNCKNVGHIEDIVVVSRMRRKGISQQILKCLEIIARENNCYKIILNCKETIKNVYIKNGFQEKELQMSKYLFN